MFTKILCTGAYLGSMYLNISHLQGLTKLLLFKIFRLQFVLTPRFLGINILNFPDSAQFTNLSIDFQMFRLISNTNNNWLVLKPVTIERSLSEQESNSSANALYPVSIILPRAANNCN